MKVQLIAITLLSVILGSAAYAGMYANSGMGMGASGNRVTFSELDINGDDQVTQSELEQFRTQRMAVRAESGRPMKNASNAPMFTALDSNNDGLVTEDEFTAHQMNQLNYRSETRGPKRMLNKQF
ncbi:EF-hand domain-containing protein [Vibrio parahaemolyticus]|uniref:EF-hand domain-containing protein n=1 Tax=Vibrio mediterranei TaxID=689 RepID=UPI004067C84E